MISVCMATYNGEEYLREQIDSILVNLNQEDELVISDDGSKDQTVKIIQGYMLADSRVKLTEGPHKGVISNFEHAIRESKGDYIFLADQDDLWEKNKVSKILEYFEKENSTVIVHDADIIDQDGKVTLPSFYSLKNSKSGALNNIIKNRYIGCCMAFKRELLMYVLPIPTNIVMHDQWIGVLGDLHGGSFFCKDVLFHYRRHGNNVSQMEHNGVGRMLKERIILCCELSKRILRGKRDYDR